MPPSVNMVHPQESSYLPLEGVVPPSECVIPPSEVPCHPLKVFRGLPVHSCGHVAALRRNDIPPSKSFFKKCMKKLLTETY